MNFLSVRIVAGYLLLGVVNFAVASSPMLTITPSTSSLTTRSDGGTSVIYTVTNNLSSMVTNMNIQAQYGSSSPASSLSLQNDSCSGSNLAAHASCQFGVVISGANQANSFTVTPRVCNGTQQICSTATSANTLTVHVDQISQDPYAYFGASDSIARNWFAAQSIANQIIPINAITHEFGTPVFGLYLSTGAHRGSIAVALDGRQVYAGEEPMDGMADIAVLSSGANCQLLKRITLPNTWQDSSLFLVVSPDGGTLYVSAADFLGENNVYAIDLSTDVVTSLPGTFDEPYALALSPDGSRLFVANYQSSGTGSISVIDTSSRAVVATLTGGVHNPSGVLVSPDGATLYISNDYSLDDSMPSITTYAISAHDVYSLVGYLDQQDIGTMTISSNGNDLYLSHLSSGDINVVNVHNSTAPPEQISTGENTSNSGIALTPNNHSLFIASLSDTNFAEKAPGLGIPRSLYPGVIVDLTTTPVFSSLNSISGISLMNQIGAFVN